MANVEALYNNTAFTAAIQDQATVGVAYKWEGRQIFLITTKRDDGILTRIYNLIVSFIWDYVAVDVALQRELLSRNVSQLFDEDAVAAKTKRVAELGGRVASLEQMIEEKSAVEGQLATVHKDLEELEAQVIKLQEEEKALLEDPKDKLAQVEAELEEAVAAKERAVEGNRTLDQELAAKTRRVEELEGRVASLEQMIEEKSAVEGQLATVHKDLEELEAQVIKLREEEKALLADPKNKLAQVEAELKEAVAAQNKAEERTRKLNNEHNATLKESQRLLKAYESLKVKTKALEARQTQLEGLVNGQVQGCLKETPEAKVFAKLKRAINEIGGTVDQFELCNRADQSSLYQDFGNSESKADAHQFRNQVKSELSHMPEKTSYQKNYLEELQNTVAAANSLLQKLSKVF